MMIELSEDGSVSDQIMAIIDWQTFFEGKILVKHNLNINLGSSVFDITRFLANCADAEVRRACEYQVIDCYYDYLTKRYKEHGKTPKIAREDAHELYELALVQETLLFTIMVSF